MTNTSTESVLKSTWREVSLPIGAVVLAASCERTAERLRSADRAAAAIRRRALEALVETTLGDYGVYQGAELQRSLMAGHGRLFSGWVRHVCRLADEVGCGRAYRNGLREGIRAQRGDAK